MSLRVSKGENVEKGMRNRSRQEWVEDKLIKLMRKREERSMV